MSVVRINDNTYIVDNERLLSEAVGSYIRENYVNEQLAIPSMENVRILPIDDTYIVSFYTYYDEDIGSYAIGYTYITKEDFKRIKKTFKFLKSLG